MSWWLSTEMIFSDTACGLTDGDWTYGECNAAFAGAMAAITLSCSNKETAEQPSSFSTINVGPIATIASSATPAATNEGEDDSSGTSSGSGPSSGCILEARGWGSLLLGTEIGIIMSLAVAIPPIVIGLITLRHYRRKQRLKKAMSPDTDLQSLAAGYLHTLSGTSADSGDSLSNSEHFHYTSGTQVPIHISILG